MYKINDIISVNVTSIVKYGVFVKTDSNYTGLIHISEINGKYIKNIENYFKVGMKIKTKIIGIDEENKHLSLSTKNINNYKKKNSLKEIGQGFDELKEKLPIWIDETIKEMENNK